MKKIQALSEEELEKVTGGARGRGGSLCTCPYCGITCNTYNLDSHVYNSHTRDAYGDGLNVNSNDN